MIEIEKVCVDFTAGRGTPTRAVDDVSLHIAAGEIFGIVGTSGAGKSTLLRTLNALTRPSQGRVNVNGVEISALDGKALRQARQRIGMIFQHFNLMHTRTVAQNVAFSLKAAGWERSKIAPRVAEILTLVGLADKANRFPVQLSGGQKQRVGIAAPSLTIRMCCCVMNRLPLWIWKLPPRFWPCSDRSTHSSGLLLY